jgi:signal transduction histidine kinase
MTDKTILIVEDEAVLALDLKKQLERMGYVVPPPLATGEEAVEQAGAILPDLVLMDIKLKGRMDGIEAAEQIRAQLSIPVVYLTAYADTDTLTRARMTDPFGYLVKPFEERELHATIEMALSKHETELELRAAYQQLEEADRLKDEMIQNVSHEFRTPLSYIVGYTGLLLDEEFGVGPLTDEQRMYLRIMARQGQKLAWLVKNFAMLQSAEEIVASNKESIDILELLSEVMGNVKLEADEAGVSVYLESTGPLPPIRANRLAISQVVDNLLTNAIKFTPSSGEITMKAWQPPDNHVIHVSVADTGIGIAAEYHERIFERFYQVNSPATRRLAGSGLGLALCKEIVEAHGGRIWVLSAPGEGATFVFELPASS